MENLDLFFQECEQAPRLNDMADFFSSTAGGLAGIPKKKPVPEYRLFEGDQGLINFMQTHCNLWGKFDPHYFASIPYRLEEDARLGDAMLRYCLSDLTMKTPKHVYILGSAEGTFARTLAHLGAGKIQTLSCSPNAENQDSFFSHGATPFSSFFWAHSITSPVTLLPPERISATSLVDSI